MTKFEYQVHINKLPTDQNEWDFSVLSKRSVPFTNDQLHTATKKKKKHTTNSTQTYF